MLLSASGDTGKRVESEYNSLSCREDVVFKIFDFCIALLNANECLRTIGYYASRRWTPGIMQLQQAAR